MVLSYLRGFNGYCYLMESPQRTPSHHIPSICDKPRFLESHRHRHHGYSICAFYSPGLDIQTQNMARCLIHGICRNYKADRVAFYSVLSHPIAERGWLETNAAIARHNWS